MLFDAKSSTPVTEMVCYWTLGSLQVCRGIALCWQAVASLFGV